jgi:hypothetical protein
LTDWVSDTLVHEPCAEVEEDPVTESWLPFQYRDFYDVPRMIVVERASNLYLFDAPFDDAADEYADRYTVYRLPESSRSVISLDSWVGLAAAGEPIGRLSVSEVEFDESRRRLINDRVFDRLPVDS